MITVSHWHGRQAVSVPAGFTVSRVLIGLQEAMDLPPDVAVLVNGEAADPDHQLWDGDTVELLRPPGQKGVGEVWTVKELAAKFRVETTEIERWIAMGLLVVPITDGTIRITETHVDEFLARGMRPVERPNSAAEAGRPPRLKLTPTERKLIKALGNKTLTGEELVEAAEIEGGCSGHIKGVLSSLVKRGVLGNFDPGYHLLQPDILAESKNET